MFFHFFVAVRKLGKMQLLRIVPLYQVRDPVSLWMPIFQSCEYQQDKRKNGLARTKSHSHSTYIKQSITWLIDKTSGVLWLNGFKLSQLVTCKITFARLCTNIKQTSINIPIENGRINNIKMKNKRGKLLYETLSWRVNNLNGSPIAVKCLTTKERWIT